MILAFLGAGAERGATVTDVRKCAHGGSQRGPAFFCPFRVHRVFGSPVRI